MEQVSMTSQKDMVNGMADIARDSPQAQTRASDDVKQIL